MKFFRSNIATCLALFSFATSGLNAATYLVSTTADSGADSLRQAIINANAGGGGNIDLTGVSGTITLGSDLPAITASVNILGPGTNALTINGSNSWSVFSMKAGTTNTLSNLTIANCFGQDIPEAGPPDPGFASGIANFGSLKVQGCILQQCNNYDTDGGAIYNSGNLEMDNCLIADCPGAHIYYGSCDVIGGGVYSTSNLTMNGCTIANCGAKAGGGLCSSGNCVLTRCLIADCGNDDPDTGGGGISCGGNTTLITCVVSNNSGGWSGGGILAGGYLVMTNTSVTHNIAKEGGGVFLGSGTNTFVNCTISTNDSWWVGGGGIKVEIGAFASVTMMGCTVNENSCTPDGGGGVSVSGSLTMTNCTVSGNTAESSGAQWSHGGGILVGGNAVLVDCTIVSNIITLGTNTALGGGIECDQGTVSIEDTIVADNTTDIYSFLNSQGHNLIKNTNGCTISGDTTGNIYGVDPLLGPLQNNGGLTATHALLPGSPAIDAGPTNAAPFVDQRGAPRPFGAADDIGAFEYGSMPCCRMASLAAVLTGGLQVKLAGIPGFTYAVQKAPSPSGPWTPFTSVTIDGDGNGACLDPSPSAESGFYRTAHP